MIALAATAVWWSFQSAVAVDRDFDAGHVVIDTPPLIIEHMFELTNISGSPLRIERAKATCGCTEFVAPDSELQPGEVYLMPVTLSLENTGKKRGGVHLTLSNGEKIDLTMTADATRTHPIRMGPNPLKLYGQPVAPFMWIEWDSAGSPPPTAVLTCSEGLVARTEPWRLKSKANEHGRPPIWNARLLIERPEGTGAGMITATVEGVPPATMDVSWGPPPTTTTDPEHDPEGPAATP